ncbi:MAG: hypothetical protein ACFFAG_04560 [Promethearchaeota archaeon]
MFFLNSYSYHIPQQILGFLIVFGIPLLILFELYFTKIRKIKQVKIIFGVVSIIYGSVIIIIAIWGNIEFTKYLENREYSILGPDYRFIFILCIGLFIILVIRGMILINKSKYVE